MASDDIDEPLPSIAGDGGIRWARAVEWAVENQHRKAISRDKVGAMRYSIWDYGRENPTQLNVHMMPRALAIIDKYEAAQQTNDPNTQSEEAAVADLDKLIAAAIKEAGV